jgi:hypothetical protein
MESHAQRPSNGDQPPAVAAQAWLHSRKYFMPDELLHRLQDLSDRSDFAPQAFNAAEDFAAAGFGVSLRLSQKWSHWAMDSSTLREIIFFPELSVPGRSAPMVSEQVLAALQILASGPARHDSETVKGVASHAQRLLSHLLVRYPVLMHPLMRFPMEDSAFHHQGKVKSPIVSVTQAVCVSGLGRFPLPEDGFTEEALTAFYRHPCTRQGLFEPPISGRGKVDPERAILWQSCVDAMVEDHKPLAPPLFASLHHAHKVLGSHAPDLRFTRAFDPDTLCTGRFAVAFQRSCKVRFGTEYPPAVVALREMGAGSNELFAAIVAKELVREMFSEVLHEIDDTEYEVRIRDVLQKLCDVGIACNTKAAAAYLLRAIESNRNDGSFKAALPRHALAFLQVLGDVGQIKFNPDAFSQPQWIAAARAVANAAAMQEAIQSSLLAANDAAAAPAPARRTARMGY